MRASTALLPFALLCFTNLAHAEEGLDCVAVRTEARARAYAFDHIVHLKNGCGATVTCRVSTNANPKVVKVTLRKDETRSITTFRGSPAREFEAKVQCTGQRKVPERRPRE